MRDESLSGGTYHGPSNAPGLTRREYAETWAEYRSPYDDLDPNEGRDDDRDDDRDAGDDE